MKLRADYLGISYRQFDHWCRIGYLRAETTGSGRDRDFTPSEIRIAHRMAELVKLGFRPEKAAEYARAVVSRQEVGSLALTPYGVAKAGVFDPSTDSENSTELSGREGTQPPDSSASAAGGQSRTG